MSEYCGHIYGDFPQRFSWFLNVSRGSTLFVSLYISLPRRHMIQGRMKLSPVDHLVDGILVLVQKDSNAKNESFCFHGTLKIVTKFTTQNKIEQKRKSKFFYISIVVSVQVGYSHRGRQFVSMVFYFLFSAFYRDIFLPPFYPPCLINKQFPEDSGDT